MKNKIFILLCLISPAGIAQIAVNSGTTLSIQSNAVVFAPGDFSNNGTVINNGSLIISGAWTNTGDYQAGSGQVTFNGSGPQIINHDAQSFTKLLISGGGDKIFRADILINNELSLQQGNLTTDNHSKIVLSQPAVITGGSETSFVEGPLYQSGTGEKFFPVGANSNFLPFTFVNVTGDNPVMGIEVIEPNPNSKTVSELKSVSSKRFWLVTTLSGTFNGSPATLSLKGEDTSLPLVVVQTSGPNDVFHSLGGSIQSESITSKDPVTLAWVAVGEEHNRNISVYNVVTPTTLDGKHDFLKIVNIEFYPNNEVTIINRWGDKVFQISGYNNVDRIFNGIGNANGTKEITDGTYYYVIDKKNGDAKMSGFFVLMR